MLCLSLKSWSLFGKLSPAVCSMERRSKVHTWELPRNPQEWEHAQAEDSWDQGFGIVHHLLTCKKHCSVVFLSILELLTYPKTCFNLSSSKLLSSVDNKEPREEKGKLHPSDVWAIITEIEACVLFLCLYWWSQVKGLMIFFFWLKITHTWSGRHSLVQDSDNFSVQSQTVNICGLASPRICDLCCC